LDNCGDVAPEISIICKDEEEASYLKIRMLLILALLF